MCSICRFGPLSITVRFLGFEVWRLGLLQVDGLGRHKDREKVRDRERERERERIA